MKKQDVGSKKNSAEQRLKVALVCDWLTNVGGAEKVLLRIHKMYPEAPIYTSKYCPEKIDWFRDAEVRTGFLQKFPLCLRRVLGPLRQWYFSHLDLSEYDLIISVTGAEAKAVKSGKWLHEHGKPSKNPDGIHISYCHVPTQYYWQMYDTYMENPGFGVLNPLIRFCFWLLVKPLRRADFKAAQRPEYFVTISTYAKSMIKKYYGREAKIIHPPVELGVFKNQEGCFEDIRSAAARGQVPAARGDGPAGHGPKNIPSDSYYITTSRQVNWKRIDIAVKAAEMAQRKLVVIGEGPEHERLVKLADGDEKIKFLSQMDREELAKYLAGAKGYLFPSLEPFGIAPVEALAAGCPVIAYGEGGALDYVVDGKNGILFTEQNAASMAEAILKFEKCKFKSSEVAKSAEKFSEERFDKELEEFVKNVKK